MTFDDLEELGRPASAEDFTAAMGRVATMAGADHFLAVRLRGARLQDVVQVLHNSPAPELVEGMRHWSLLRMLDAMRAAAMPVVFGTGASPGPEVPGLTAGVCAMCHEARGAALVYLARGALSLEANEVMPLMRASLLAAHHALAGLQKLHAASCPLSERELQCLQLAFSGEQSSKAISQALGISARTVEHYLDQARRKLGVESTIAAGVKAVHQGWMDLPPGGPIQITG